MISIFKVMHKGLNVAGQPGGFYDGIGWFGFFAQAGTPDDVINTLSEACAEAVARDRFKKNMAGANRMIRYLDTDTFRPFFRQAYELNGQLLKDAGLIK